jgi:ferredoxin
MAPADIQAIPALYACAMGELGKYGSLIHPKFGAGFRPGFVITDAPVRVSGINIFGVQKTCENCRLCEQNCPPGAIRSSQDFIVTDGVKRWLVDIPACFRSLPVPRGILPHLRRCLPLSAGEPRSGAGLGLQILYEKTQASGLPDTVLVYRG